MRNIAYLFIAVLLLAACGGKGEAEVGEKESADMAPAVDTAALRAAEEQARADSMAVRALRGDSLKARHIVVDKESLTLYVREDGETLMTAPVCVGMGIGQKKRKGDHKTPEGTFKITSIAKADSWTYDFHDGRGKVKGAYGPWFFRLNTPQSPHIGIHGTLFPESMGKRESDGCVRMRNEDLDSLRKYVSNGMTVIINPDNPES